MTLHYVPMGKSKTGPKQRVYHGQNDAVSGNFGYDRDKESEKEKLKRSLHGENAHVPDCLVWDIDDKSNRKYEAGYGSPRHQRKDYMSKRTPRGNEFSITNYKPLPRHPELGRARNHLYGEDGPPNLQWKVKLNDGGVAEAMVGWPETKREEEERYGRNGTEWEVSLGAGNGNAAGKDSKPRKPRKQRIDEGDSDVIMDELIAHRFLRENEEKLRQQREQQKIDEATAYKNRHNIRENKTSVLRSEYINGTAYNREWEDPKELWKMPRFTNAKSKFKDCTRHETHDCYHEDGRGYPLDSSRKDCKTKCDKRAGDKRSGEPSDCQCRDHRTCGCVPQRPQHSSDYEQRPYQPHSRGQYTYSDEEPPKDGSTFFIV